MLGTDITDLTRPVRLCDRTERATGQVAVSELTANQHAKVVTGRKGLVHLASSARRPREARACGSEATDSYSESGGGHYQHAPPGTASAAARGNRRCLPRRERAPH